MSRIVLSLTCILLNLSLGTVVQANDLTEVSTKRDSLARHKMARCTSSDNLDIWY